MTRELGMMTWRGRPIAPICCYLLSLTILTLSVVAPAFAAGLERGPVFSIDKKGEKFEGDGRPSIAVLANGDIIFVWDVVRDGQSFVAARRFSSEGIPQGGEFRVNRLASGDAGGADVAALSDGGFVVVWGASAKAPSRSQLFAQRFSANGERLGPQHGVAWPSFEEYQGLARVVGLAGGGYTIYWRSSFHVNEDNLRLFGQRFSSSGEKIGAKFRLTLTPPLSYDAVVLKNGNRVAIWCSQAGGDATVVSGRIFSATDVPLGSEFQVSTTAGKYCSAPHIASLADGSFVVVWMTYDSLFRYVAYGRKFAADGIAISSEFIDAASENDYAGPTVAAASGGDFVIISGARGGAQLYSSSAAKIGSKIKIATSFFEHTTVAVSGLLDNRFIASWEKDVRPGEHEISARFISISEELTSRAAGRVIGTSSK